MEQPAASPAARAAASPLTRLPPELLQHCFSFLDDDSRQSVLDVSRGWHAALTAAPELAPTVHLTCVFEDYTEEYEGLFRQASGEPERHIPCPQCNHAVCAKLRTALGRLRSLSRRTQRVRLDGYDWTLNGRGEGPNLLPRALQLLPPGIAALELNSFCIPEAIAALARFTALQQLELTGNAMEVDWAQPAAEAVVPLLRSLRLLYCSYEMPGSLMGIVRILVCIPDDAASALMAASRLERLALQVQRWSSDVLTVCEALPALRDLSIDLQPDTMGGIDVAPSTALSADLPPTIAALRCLTRLTALRLAAGTDEYAHWMDWEDLEDADLQLPPLAGLSALTELKLRLYVLPPPDWQRLTSLRRLELCEEVDWGDQPLTGLSRLTHLSLLRDALPEAACLASLPSLVSVHAPDATDEWRQQLSALLPHVEVTGDA